MNEKNLEFEKATPELSSYRWVVLMAAFCTMFTTGSISYASGVIHVGLLETFQETSTTLIVWIGSIFLCMFGPAGPLASAVINLSSCRTCVIMSGIIALLGYSTNFIISDAKWLILTYGILGGSSIGLSVVGSLVSLSYHFQGNVGIASGVAMCGQALGMFVHPPLQQYMIDQFGVRGAFLLLGGISAHACVFGLLMTPNSVERTRHTKASSGRTQQMRLCSSLCGDCLQYRQIVKYDSFLFLLIAATAFGMAVSTECLYIPDFFQKYGASKQVSSFAMSFSGVGSLVSRIIIGMIAKDENIGSGLLYSCSNGIIGIVTLFITTFSGSTAKILVYGFLLGIYTGGNWALMSPMSIEILGLDLSATGLGLLMLAYGNGFLTGPPISNAIYDYTGQYYHVFIFAALMFLLSCVSGCISTISTKRSETTTYHTTKLITETNGTCHRDTKCIDGGDGTITIVVDKRNELDYPDTLQNKAHVNTG